MKCLRSVSTFLLALLASTACCALGGCPPPSQFPTPRALLDSMREGHACSRALRGEGRLDAFDESGRVRAKTVFLTAHPANLRFDVLSPLGASMATLTADTTSFSLLDQKERMFFIGPASQCNVERFLKVPIPPEALVQLLGGEAPILVHEPAQARLHFSGGRYVVQIDSKHDAQQRIEIEPREEDWHKPWQKQGLRVREVSVEQRGVELYRAELKEYRSIRTAGPRRDPDGIDPDLPPSGPQCRAEVPGKVRFVVPIAERDVVFEQQQLEHNPPLVPGAFIQPVPRGVVVRRSLCEE